MSSFTRRMFKRQNLIIREGTETYEVDGSVPQESVLGPRSCHIIYDRILLLQLPNWRIIIRFADDTAVVKNLEEMTETVDGAICIVHEWQSI